MLAITADKEYPVNDSVSWLHANIPVRNWFYMLL